MLSICDLTKSELTALYRHTSELVLLVENLTLTPTTSTTGLVYHGQILLTVIEARLAEIDPLPVRARSRKPASQSSEVK